MNITEKLYDDITNIVIPKLSDGLSVAKDYGMDLGHRYTHYLIMTDTLLISISLIAFVAIMITIYKRWKISGEWKDYESIIVFRALILFILGGGITIISLNGVLSNSMKLIKDLTIPEVRIYQEIQSQGLIK